MHPSTTRDPDARLPMPEWGQDHWSTLAYLETLVVEFGGFQVGLDARMRTGRPSWRALGEGCPKPVRTGAHNGVGMPMDDGHGSRLRDGSTALGHDDWDCLRDAAGEGLLTARASDGGNVPVAIGPDGVSAGAWLTLSDRGATLVAELRAHKARGGRFRDFVAYEAGATTA